MASALRICILVAAALGAAGSSLRNGQRMLNNAVPAKTAVPADAAQVAQLRGKLLKISGGLSKMLSPTGELHQTKVSDMISQFNTELQGVLKATEQPKDMKAAVKQLQDAQAGVQTLSKAITQQQVNLVAEGDAQEESLLMGVLMQRQKDPLSKQMEVLTSAEFAHLKVVQFVLAAKDTKTPLFQQVATYLDAHAPKPVPVKADPKEAIPDKLTVGKDGKPDVTPIVLALETRLHKMEDNEKHMEQHHQESMKEFDRLAVDKKTSKAAARRVKKMKRSEERQFAKQSAMGKHDIQAISSAVEAVKKGDMSALAKAQTALDASMKAAQARSGKFLVLIQMMQRAQSLDCPYCAAQCVDKCHTEGKSYTTCLTDCADAGK